MLKKYPLQWWRKTGIIIVPLSPAVFVIKTAFNVSSPALFGYIALGISFGFLFVKMGLPWWLAPIMSFIVYAGAAQFIALTLLANHAGLLQILGATFIVNLRHIFYGLSFLGKFPDSLPKKLYMVFGLTDEAYSILSAQKNMIANLPSG